MQPTKILEEPTIVRNRMRIICDNGKTYTTSTLAAEIGMSQAGFYLRLQKLGWQHPDVLQPKNCGGGWFGTKRTWTANTSDYATLSTKNRAAKLAKIPEPTKFDRIFG